MLTPNLSGNFSTPTPAGDFSLLFARTWAERLKAQLPVVRAASDKLCSIDRQIEYMEEWSPNESDYELSFRALWAEYMLTVWIADELRRWLVRLADELREDHPLDIPELHKLRNALVHLDEAAFDESGAHAGEKPRKIETCEIFREAGFLYSRGRLSHLCST